MKEVNVIKYNEDKYEEKEKMKSIYYPNYTFEIELEIKRVLGKSKHLKRYVTVDLLRNRALLADSFPVIESCEIDEEKLLPTIIGYEKALAQAKKKAFHSILTKVMTFYGPDYNIIQEEKVYKEFLIRENDDLVEIIDTVTGDIEETDEIILPNNQLKTVS